MAPQNDTLGGNYYTLVSVCAALGLSWTICWSLLLLFSPALSLFAHKSIEVQSVAVAFAFFACAATSMLAWRFARVLYAYKSTLPTIGCLLSVPAAIVLYVGSSTLFVMPVGGIIALWVVFGISFAFSRIGWNLLLSEISSRNTLTIVACGSLLGTLLFLMLSFVEVALFGLFFLVIGAIASAALLRVLLRTCEERSANAATTSKQRPLSALKKLFSACVHGVTYGIVASLLFTFGTHVVIIAVACGMAGGLATLIFSRFVRKLDTDTLVIQRLTLIPIIASLFMIPLLDNNGQIVCCCIFNAIHSFYRTTDFGVLAVANSEFRLDPAERSFPGFSAHQVGLGVGLLLGLLFYFLPVLEASSVHYFFGIVVVVLLAVTVFDGLSESKGNGIAESYNESHPRASGELMGGHYKYRMHAISEKYNLSPREKEVFHYLAHGRNARHIQEELFLAHGTVKTHIAHIYQKLAINSQQQLMDLIEEEQGKD